MAVNTWTPEWKAEIVKQKTLLGWNYAQLARAAGLGIGQVQKYVAGKYPCDNPRVPIERALERAMKAKEKTL